MSGATWPKIGVKPAALPEHATQLKHEATKLQAFANGKTEDGKPKKTVQWSYLEPFIVSVQEMANRVLNQPGTAQIAADLGALVRKMDTVEQNTTITKNLLEAPINRDSTPSSSATTGYRNTRLWAQVAAQAPSPLSAASFPSTFAAQSTQGTTIDLSTPDDRRVIVKLDPTLIDHYRTLTPRTLRDRITSHIHTSADQNIAALRVAAAKQLRSGDLAIYTHTVAEKEALQASPNWARAFGAGKVVATTYGVIAHGIPTISVKMDNQKQTIARIQAKNHKIGTDISVGYVGWLCPPKRAAGSMIVEFLDAEQANLALQTGLVWDSEYKKTELYDRACRIQECFQCHKYGHISAQCGGQQKCGICAEGHRSEDCPSKDLGKWKCASCGGPHRARDSKCPDYQKEVVRVQVARSTKRTHWRVPNFRACTQSSASTPASDTSRPDIAPNDFHPTQSKVSPQSRVSPEKGVSASASSKASVARALQRASILPTPKPKSTLNTNRKRPASPTKTDANRTPLGFINSNGRSKRTITKSLKQRSIEAEEEAARSADIWEVPSTAEQMFAPVSTTSTDTSTASAASKTYPETFKNSIILQPESSAVTDTATSTSI